MKHEDVFFTAGTDRKGAELVGKRELRHRSWEEAVAAALEFFEDRGVEPAAVLTVVESRREKVDRSEVTLAPLQNVLYALEERYDCSDHHELDVTPPMQDAEERFLATVIAEYVSWNVEPIRSFTVEAPGKKVRRLVSLARDEEPVG